MRSILRAKHPLFGVRLCLLLFVFVSFSPTSLACNEATYNGGQDWYPYFYRQNQLAKGIVNDILLQAADNTGITLELLPDMPWKRQLLQLKAGNIDFMAGIIRTQERADDFQYSHPVSEARLSIFTSRENQIEFESLADLKDLRGVKLLGMSLGSEADEYAFENLVIDETLSTRALFKMVEVGRADYAVMYLSAGNRYLAEHNLTQKIVAETKPLTVIDIHIAATNNGKCPSAIDRVFSEIMNMHDAGQTKEFEKRYMDKQALRQNEGDKHES